MQDTAGEVRTISQVMYSYGPLGRAKVGRLARTYIQQPCEATGCCPEDLPEAMNDREGWWDGVRDIRADGTTRWWWVVRRRWPWCNGYRRRKWIQRHEFESLARLITFNIALIPLGKVWIKLFFLQLLVDSREDWVHCSWLGNQSKRRKTLN